MQYVSPLSLFADVTSLAPGKQNFTLEKKKMLAELELNGGSIMVNNQELFKNDIINFFDSLQQDENINYHIIIANDPVLLRFLEHNVLEKGDRFINTELYRDEKFINWVSGYYCTSFSIVAANCLNYLYDDEWLALMANPLLMTAADLEDAWAEVEKEVQKSLDELNTFFNANSTAGKDVVEPLISFRYISMLQRLPDERFTMLKDRYAYMVMQCSIRIFNKVNRGIGLIIVENGLSLAVSENIRRQIRDKMVEMQVLNSKSEKRGSGWNGRGAWFLVFVIIRIIWYIASSSDSNSNYEFQNTIPVYNYSKDTNLQRLMDSVRMQSDSAKEKHHFDSLTETLQNIKPVHANP